MKIKKIKFDSKITKTIDDTDYFYRLSKKHRFGIAETKILSYHEKGFFKYFKNSFGMEKVMPSFVININ